VVPGGVGEGQLAAVTCATASDCVAVGYEADATGAHRTSVQVWHGGSWESAASPSPTDARGVQLLGVTCPAAGACVAVGRYPHALDITQPVGLNLSGGRWVTTLAELVGEASAGLQSVACTAPAECWAVGYEIAGYRAVVSRWNGARWENAASPKDPAASSEGLYGVTCTSSADCWAVGWARQPGGFQPLVVHWDGATWKHAEAPALLPAGQSGYLHGVACASATACWAVGITTDADLVAHPFVARWDGTSWRNDLSHAASSRLEGALEAVTCTATDDCWAVGAHGPTSLQQPLIEHWDGNAWTPVAPAEPTVERSGALLAVACQSRSDCWAVGGRADAGGTFHTLAEHWNGSSWSVVASPNAPGGHTVLEGVACSAAARCWAVGANVVGQRPRTFLQTWDGGSWTTVAAPTPAATRANLAGIACVRGTPHCRAVGYWADPVQLHTLAAHHPVAQGSASSLGAAAPAAAAASGAPARRRARPRIRLRVTPTRVRARRRTRFRFTARVAGRPVRGAVVTFAGRRARTNRRGRAVLVRSVKPGRHRARAAKRGLTTGVAVVRARRARR
jgi:hypothetical protein